MPMLVLSVTGYDAPAPPNAFAEEDASRFEKAFASYDNITLTRGESPPTSGELLEAIEEYLRHVRAGGPDKQAVLIYLSAHGIVNDQGEPCLLFPQDDPLDSAGWLPVSQLLGVLDQRPDADQNSIVLLLDAHRLKDAWRMGVALNSFSYALDRLIASSPPRQCTIVSSASPWQTAQAAPELSGSPFGYYAARGLRGDADSEGNGDKVVTLGELADYLGRHVSAWSAQNRGESQLPHVLGQEGELLRLVDVAGGAEIATAPWKPPIDRGEFREIFSRVRALERSPAFAAYPYHWAKVQYLLECLDAESLAGAAYAPAANDTLRELNETLADLETRTSSLPIFKPLTLAVQGRHLEARGEELSAIWEAWLKDPAAVKDPPPYDAASSFVWQRLCQEDGPLTKEELAKRLEFCSLAGDASGTDYAELGIVRLLDKYVDWPSRAFKNNVAPRRLLSARAESERLAANEDPRVHYAIAGILQKADQKQAEVLDQILIGDDQALHQADRALNELLGADGASYAAIGKLADLMFNALRARDKAFSSLIHLNHLHLRRARWDENVRAQSVLHDLARDSVLLAELLDKIIGQFPESPGRSDVDRLGELTAHVDEAMNELQTQYATRVADVAIEERGSQEQTARETPYLLACPIGFDEGRQRLHEQWVDRVTTSLGTSTPNASPSNASTAPPDLAYLGWLASEGVAPLRAFIAEVNDSQSSSPTTELSETAIAAKLAELGGQIRQVLQSAPDVYEQLRSQSTDALANQPASQARSGWSRADGMARRLAPLGGNAVLFHAEDDPTALLHRLDAQAWILWHGHRALNDCWGSVTSDSGDVLPYFARAAAQAIDDAKRLYPDADGVGKLRQRLADTQQVVSQWNPLITKDLFVAEDGGDYVAHQVVFRGDSQMPRGNVAVYLSDEAAAPFPTYSPTELEVRRTSLDLQKDGVLDQQLNAEAVSKAPALYANALFRGHVRQEVFSIGRGTFVEWQRPGPQVASVVVSGESTQISQIYFVVDCSGSMKRYGDRLKEGREKLKAILDRLVTQGGQFRVGLIVYGRQAGWVEETPGNFVIKHLDKQKYNGPPGDDIEIVFTPQPLTKEHAAAINNFLAQVEPIGETPLYHALTTALQRFIGGVSGTRHIVAITDGVDDVTNDPRWPVAKVFTPRDVEQALAQNPAKIDVIEFGVNQALLTDRDRARWPAGQAALKKIATSKQSRGNFREARNAAKLEEELLDALRIDRYRLTPLSADGGSEITEWLELAQPTKLSPSPTTTRYRVSLETHNAPPVEIEISGGEAVQLTYRQPPENRLIFPRYAAEDRRLGQTVKGTVVTSYVPNSELQDPVFRISIESDDQRQFSRRPDIIWAKAESIEQGDRRSHYFFDPEFESGLPVPMLNLRARNWTGSDFARVDLNFIVDQSVIKKPWSAIPKVGSAAIESHNAVLQVKSEIDGDRCRVIVDEKHAAGQDFPLNIQLDPPPDRIRRTLFESDRSARHVFDYSVQPGNPKLRALSQREIETAGARVVFERIELAD
jgi:hypothetical protein